MTYQISIFLIPLEKITPGPHYKNIPHHPSSFRHRSARDTHTFCLRLLLFCCVENISLRVARTSVQHEITSIHPPPPSLLLLPLISPKNVPCLLEQTCQMSFRPRPTSFIIFPIVILFIQPMSRHFRFSTSISCVSSGYDRNSSHLLLL